MTAITNFGSLKTAVADWSLRSDLASVIPDFVVYAETIFNYGDGQPGDGSYIPPLRTRDMETISATISSVANVAALPTDFLATIRVQTDASPTRDLIYKDPNWYTENYPSGDSTMPQFYTVIGSNIIVSADIILTYYAKIPTITAADPNTNWLLTASPNAYLYGTQYHLYIYMQEGDKAGAARGLMANAMASLGNVSNFSRAGSYVRSSSMMATG